MSTQAKPEFEPSPISEEAVCDYLSQFPDFFEKHHDLLRSLRLPHVTGGTVSLVERQVSALRQRDVKLERRLKELLEVARSNDVLAGKIHALSLRLLGCGSLEETIRTIESALRTEFDAEQSVLVLFVDPAGAEDLDAGRFLRVSERENKAWLAFETLLKRSIPRCGQIRDSQRDELFGTGTDEIGSCALVPLGSECALGFLAIGSADADRFHPAMSIDFLTRLGELVASALSRYQT